MNDGTKKEKTDEESGDTEESPFRLTKENFPNVNTTLLYFIQLLATHGYIYLGLIPIPGSLETMFDLAQARRAIDLLGVMVEQAKPELEEHDRRELDNTVSQLRLNFATKASKA